METILFTVLMTGLGITVGLAIALAVNSYHEREEIFAREIQRQQDLHVSAQINALHEQIQALKRQNKTLTVNNMAFAATLTTRMNDTPVVRSVHSAVTTEETRS